MTEQRSPSGSTPLGEGTGMAVHIDPPSAAQAHLADRVRRLVEAVVMVDAADEAALAAAADQTQRAVEALDAHRRQGPHRRLTSQGDGLAFHLNPVLGVANPYAPPIEVEIVDGEVQAHGVLNEAYEGPPGYVHGGILSLVLDQTLGLANLVAGHPGMTVGLDVRYRRPTPLHERVTFTSRFSHTEGRTIYCEGAVEVGGRTTVEATGTFRSLTEEHGRTLFADRQEPETGGGDPA